MVLDILKLQEEVGFDKTILYTNLRLFIENEESVEIKLIKSFDKLDSGELYEATEELYQMTEFLQTEKLQKKIRDLQILALHNNLRQPLAEKLKDSIVLILAEIKEEINYILTDQQEN